MISSKSYGLQNETRQYLRRLYAYGRELAPTDVNDIDNFVKGLKQLNLWQDSVSWLLGGKHNIGTGSTALSLGGQASVLTDGTLINGPTWNNDGIEFTRTLATCIQTQRLPLLPRTVFCWALFYPRTTAFTEQFILSHGDNTSPPYPGWWIQLLAGNFTFGFSPADFSDLHYTSVTFNNINTWSYGGGTRTIRTRQAFYENSSSGIGTTTGPFIGYTTQSRSFTIGRSNSNTSSSFAFNGRIAACGFTASGISNTTFTPIRSLLRTTIGKDLGFN